MLSAYDIREFYAGKTGRYVSRILSEKLASIIPNSKKATILAGGFPFPYMSAFDGAERTLTFTPSALGAYLWPSPSLGKNLCGLTHFSELPIPDSCIDYAFLIHGLEFLEAPNESLAELWRVLKPNGRLLMIAPSRSGFWARADHTPFGQGQPYSFGQLRRLVKSEDFVVENTHTALHGPAFKSNLMLNSFQWLETLGQYIPLFSGVYIIEASKKVYATTNPIRAKSYDKKRRFAVASGATPQPS